MSSVTIFLNSSIGKKLIMAVTGSFLIIFLIVHLIGNITLFFGANAFNGYVATLDVIKPLIRVIEVVLLTAFVLHIFNGTKLWIENKRARGINYKVNGSSENSNVYSRTMFLSGSIIFIFLISHLGTFFWRFNVYDPMGLADIHQYFDIVVYFFGIWWYVILYIIAMILLGIHLNHGFQSAFQTFGWNHKTYFPLIQKIGTIYAVIMSIGFASMPVYFFFFYGGN
ncbi:MAG: succinate dehydrogenase cytochrome b subunit [Ignavibacteriota bacterium]|nr:MAG: succinate dehydrogenase [Chlorobiota bacterium]MBE7476764.1 succinate dehydrogenase cytochrome b subunit [Ignavibacteriales bacterium]MBL1121983.1 succinate dehydrogenase [Ignavibacteriota bacterium]MCC7092765.1 succinate dehydrogenase cytochrome b subunit [Ignavibacteriaceae bacterium]MCE7856407.1 succinate dehydrogenase [Ignavibacteria bacterium CHB3]MEB2295026.1 succinate dehydrogenase cytochrome b subunit [Ignavibacteria bacterium]